MGGIKTQLVSGSQSRSGSSSESREAREPSDGAPSFLRKLSYARGFTALRRSERVLLGCPDEKESTSWCVAPDFSPLAPVFFFPLLLSVFAEEEEVLCWGRLTKGI